MSYNFNIKKEASQFRLINGFGQTEPIRLKSLLLKLNVLTAFKPLNDAFSGMAVKANNHRFMLINSNHTLGRQHFSICHELYHLFIQSDFSSMICQTGTFNKKDKIEYEADWFAAYFLMPEEGILSLIPEKEFKRNKIKLGTIVKIEQSFSCSRSALLFRLEDLGLIDRSEYKGYESNVRDSAKYYGFTNELYDNGNHNLIVGNYGEVAKNLFDNEAISESHYVSLMQDIGIDLEA